MTSCLKELFREQAAHRILARRSNGLFARESHVVATVSTWSFSYVRNAEPHALTPDKLRCTPPIPGD